MSTDKHIVPPFIDLITRSLGSDANSAMFLKAIFNSDDSLQIRQLITVHGEHIPTRPMPEIPGLKFCMTYLAACGTVNWSDNSVNVVILEQYEELLKEPGLIQLNLQAGPSLDIYYFVLAIRLAHRLENVDTVHDRSRVTGEALSAGYFSRFKNFSVTLPTFDENKLKQVIAILSTRMNDDSNNAALISLLTGFSLPTQDYYLKRYSLGSRSDNNEHLSWVVHPTETDEEDALDKGYEHKVCFFVPRTPIQISQSRPNVSQLETAFLTNIHNLFTTTPSLSTVLSIANIPRSADNRTDKEKSKKVHIPVNQATIIGGSVPYTMDSVKPHLHDEINYGSPTWNKLVITVSQGGLPLSTVVQWKINLRQTTTQFEPDLVFNVWNIVASRPGMGGRLSEVGQENYLATTDELNHFAKRLGATYVTGTDPTCSVIGGKNVDGWPILNAKTWTERTRQQQSKLLFLRPPTIPSIIGCPALRTGPTSYHPPCDLRKHTYNLVEGAAIIFDTITDVKLNPKKIDEWKRGFKRRLEIFSDARTSRHSVNIRDEFYAVLQLFDALSTSDSIESRLLTMHPVITTALQRVVSANPGITSSLSTLGIITVDHLVQGIYRYLRHVTTHLYGAYKTYTEGNLAPGGNVALVLDDTMLTQFVMIINALKLSFFSFQFKSLVHMKTRSDDAHLVALKTKILKEANENATKLKAARTRVRKTAVADEDDLSEDNKISEYSEQLYALPYLSSDEIEAFLNTVRQLFGLSTDDKQADLVDAQLLDVIRRIIIPGLSSLTDDDQVLSASGGTRRRRHRKLRRTNRNKSPRRMSRYNNKNKKNNKNNKKKTNRVRRYV